MERQSLDKSRQWGVSVPQVRAG